MRNIFLYFIVFISGGVVLAVEILGTRLLGPFYGVSLFLWSALITVTLVALSIGYLLGGRWADRGPRFERIGYLLAVAGIWLLLLPWLKYPILRLTEPLGLRMAVLIVAFILFTPPLTLLGMISPYAIRVRVSYLEEVGSRAGDLYAISTIGSVCFALLTGFVLIPSIGVTQLILSFGVLLLATAATGLLIHQGMRKTTVALLILIPVAVGMTIRSDALYGASREGVVAIEQSAYAEIRVLDNKSGRHLLIDGGIHTIVDPQTYQSFYPYVHVMDLCRNFFEEPGRLAVVGLGGGSVVRNYARAGWEVDAIEIDPVVTKVAHRYFGLDSSHAQIFHLDGRRFFQQTSQRYEVIVLDAFGSSSIPFHLVTTEAFAVIGEHLADRGILAVNIESVGWRSRFVRALAATLKTRFDYVQVLPLVEPPTRLGNLILLAAHHPLELLKPLPATRSRFAVQYHLNHAWDNRFLPDISQAFILTDELNPVDVWSEDINVAAREYLHDYFQRDGQAW